MEYLQAKAYILRVYNSIPTSGSKTSQTDGVYFATGERLLHGHCTFRALLSSVATFTFGDALNISLKRLIQGFTATLTGLQ